MKTIVIVGVGALGSHVAQFLRSAGATIKVVDFDRVEQKNTLSQFHGKPSVGKTKVLALQQSMQFLWGVKIDVIPHKLASDNVEAVLGAPSLVIDCLDNAPSRRVVQAYVRARGIPCLHGALAADGGFGRVVWDEKFVIDDATPGAATCEDGEHLPFIALASAHLARAAQIFLASGRKSGFEINPLGGSIGT